MNSTWVMGGYLCNNGVFIHSRAPRPRMNTYASDIENERNWTWALPTFMKYDKEGAANNKQDGLKEMGWARQRVIVSNPDSMIYEIDKFYSPP